jgi:hypothetical protein
MTRLNVVVEGETEEAFVDGVLGPHLARVDVKATPILVPTKPGTRSRTHRGGIGHYDPVKRIIERLVLNQPEAYTTTLFDYYGLPDSFPGINDPDCPPRPRLHRRIEYLERALEEDIGDTHRFIAYFQLHEFEALLFSDVDTLHREVRSASDRDDANALLDELRNVVIQHDSPEDIDDDPETAPSKRLTALYSEYEKPFFGELVAESIGLDAIRSECPRFDDWLARLETLDPLDS